MHWKRPQDRCCSMEKLISVGADRMRFFEEQRDASLALLRKVIAEGKQLEVARQRLLAFLFDKDVAKHHKEEIQEALLSGDVEIAVKLIHQVKQSLDSNGTKLNGCACESADMPMAEAHGRGSISAGGLPAGQCPEQSHGWMDGEADGEGELVATQVHLDRTVKPYEDLSRSLADVSIQNPVWESPCTNGTASGSKEQGAELLMHHDDASQQHRSGITVLTPFSTPNKDTVSTDHADESPQMGVFHSTTKVHTVQQWTSPHSSPHLTEGARRLLEEASHEFGKITPPSPLIIGRDRTSGIQRSRRLELENDRGGESNGYRIQDDPAAVAAVAPRLRLARATLPSGTAQEVANAPPPDVSPDLAPVHCSGTAVPNSEGHNRSTGNLNPRDRYLRGGGTGGRERNVYYCVERRTIPFRSCRSALTSCREQATFLCTQIQGQIPGFVKKKDKSKEL